MPHMDGERRISSLLKLQSMLDYLNPAEQRVADYLIKNPREALTLTIHQLADKTDTSYATVTRLVKRIGFSGYKELKNNLYHDVLSYDDLDMLDLIKLSQDTSIEAVCESSFELATRALGDSYQILDPEVVRKIVECLLSANSILFIGSGLSGISARYAYIKFFRIGLRAIHESDATLYRMHASLLGKGDVLFAISSSGRTEEIVECARLAASQGATVISLSDYVLSPLSQSSQYSLFTTTRSNNVFLGIDLPLTTSQLAVIDTVYLGACVQMGKVSSELYTKTKRSADAEKIR